MRHRTGFGRRDVGGVADREDVVVGIRQQRVLVHRDVVEIVAEAGAGDVVRAHVHRDGHQQVEGNLALVERHDLLVFIVDALDHEVGLYVHIAGVEHVAEVLGGDWLGECTLQRRDVGDVHLVAHALFGEVGIGEEGELQRCYRALDGHLANLHDEFATLPVAQFLAERNGTLVGVELVHALAEFVAVHARRLVWARRGAGGDDQVVVGEFRAVYEQHLVVVGFDLVDLAEDHVHTGRDEPRLRLDDLVGSVDAEGHEQVTGLVVVSVVGINDGDQPLIARQLGA